MVLSAVDDSGMLQRLYLNDSAVTALLGPKPEEVLTALSARGMCPDSVLPLLPKIESDWKLCKELCEKNSWDLFSLHPLQLSLQLLEHCNARCDFCYAGAAHRPASRLMSPGTAMALKDYAAENGVKLGMTGGEPLLHPDIIKLLEYRSEEVFDTLITNLTPKVDITELAATDVDLIQVSIHGKGKVHDKILGIPGAYRLATGRMAALSGSVNLATNTVIRPGETDVTEELLGEFAELQSENGFRLAYVRLVPVVPSGTGRDRYGTEEDFFTECRNALTAIEREWGRELELELPLLHPNPYEYRSIGERNTCPAGATVAVVRADARVSPCNQFVDTHRATESVFEGDFRKIWLEDPMLCSMRRARATPPGGDFCGGCAYLESMRGH